MGVAHHSVFPVWLELARTQILRESGSSYAKATREGLCLAVAEMAIRYRSPAKYDDVLAITARVVRATRAKLVHEYVVRLETREGEELSGLLIATATTTLASLDAGGRPIALPGWLCGA